MRIRTLWADVSMFPSPMHPTGGATATLESTPTPRPPRPSRELCGPTARRRGGTKPSARAPSLRACVRSRRGATPRRSPLLPPRSPCPPPAPRHRPSPVTRRMSVHVSEQERETPAQHAGAKSGAEVGSSRIRYPCLKKLQELQKII